MRGQSQGAKPNFWQAGRGRGRGAPGGRGRRGGRGGLCREEWCDGQTRTLQKVQSQSKKGCLAESPPKK